MTRKSSALERSNAEEPHPAGEARIREVVGLHHALVWRLVRRLGVPAADAEDAVQRVFLVVARRLHDIEPGRERAFLTASAVRVASEIRRSEARRPLELTADIDEMRDGAAQPDELVESYRARRLLDAVLEDMPEDARSVFVLFEVEELTFTEIASVLSIPRGTVASRLARARAWFSAEIARRLGTPPRKDESP